MRPQQPSISYKTPYAISVIVPGDPAPARTACQLYNFVLCFILQAKLEKERGKIKSSVVKILAQPL
jgi:hypothetical protein